MLSVSTRRNRTHHAERSGEGTRPEVGAALLVVVLVAGCPSRSTLWLGSAGPALACFLSALCICPSSFSAERVRRPVLSSSHLHLPLTTFFCVHSPPFGKDFSSTRSTRATAPLDPAQPDQGEPNPPSGTSRPRSSRSRRLLTQTLSSRRLLNDGRVAAGFRRALDRSPARCARPRASPFRRAALTSVRFPALQESNDTASNGISLQKLSNELTARAADLPPYELRRCERVRLLVSSSPSRSLPLR